MIKSDKIAQLYNKTKDFESLRNKHLSIKYNIYMAILIIGVLIVFSSLFTFAYLEQQKNQYLLFVFIPITMGILLFSLGYRLSQILINDQIDYFPNIFKNFSRKVELKNSFKDVVFEMCGSSIQLELINFFDSLNIDSKRLQLQLATEDYINAIKEINRLFNIQIIEEDLKKKLLIENKLIEAHHEQLRQIVNRKQN